MDWEDCKNKKLVNYYGKNVEIEEAKDLIKSMVHLRDNLIEKYIK